MAAASYDTEIPVPSMEPPPQREDYVGPSDPVPDAGGAVARWLSAMPAASRTPGGGVFVYFQEEAGGFRIVRLARESQALALALQDLDGDGRLDIHVGNDFALPDAVFLAAGNRWERAEPFAAMTRNTMSLDAGDVDNDGVDETAGDALPLQSARRSPPKSASSPWLSAGTRGHAPSGGCTPRCRGSVLSASRKSRSGSPPSRR